MADFCQTSTLWRRNLILQSFMAALIYLSQNTLTKSFVKLKNGGGEREAQQVEDERGGMAAARLPSSGDWWCTCECCAPVPTEEECLCCKEWDRLQPYFQGLDVTEDETPPGVVSSWALSRARKIYFGCALESRARQQTNMAPHRQGKTTHPHVVLHMLSDIHPNDMRRSPWKKSLSSGPTPHLKGCPLTHASTGLAPPCAPAVSRPTINMPTTIFMSLVTRNKSRTVGDRLKQTEISL